MMPGAPRRRNALPGPLAVLSLAPGLLGWAFASALLGAWASLLTIAQPFILAPAVSAALRSPEPPATKLSQVSFNNLGATIAEIAGWDLHDDRSRIVLLSVGLYALVVAAAAGLSLATTRLGRRIQWRATTELQLLFFRRALAQPMGFFRSQRAGHLTARVASDAAAVARTAESAARSVWEAGLQLVLFGVLLLRTDMTLALTVGAAVMVHVLVSRALHARLSSAARVQGDAPATVAGHVQDVLAGARIVKAFAAETFEQCRLVAVQAANRGQALRASLPGDSEGPLRDVVNAFAVGVAVIAAFSGLASGRLTLSGFALFVFAARQTIIPFSRLATAVSQITAGKEAARRAFEVLGKDRPSSDGVIQTPLLRSELVLEGVGFAYDEGAPVLRDVSLTIPRGARVALVGPSGAGKSTLADLLLRLEAPSQGRITYDGIDIREFTLESYLQRFGVVSQEVFLFHASVAENIAYGRPLVREEVERAALTADATVFIGALPRGYDTLVGERGSRLSGGERQRLAIARAVYGRPDILVLDEATAALDTNADREVQAAIERALEGTTAVVIAHRLSTVVRADLIAVLDGGRILANGRHEVLLDTCTLYRELWEAQFHGVGSLPRTPASR
jgi:ABC-type multidrug transport system fused ATPase/permease subunit